jgi:DsbC/DsbD-like thiol-disulfide interchange protein
MIVGFSIGYHNCPMWLGHCVGCRRIDKMDARRFLRTFPSTMTMKSTLLLLAVGLAALAFSQAPSPKATLKLENAKVAPGGMVRGTVTIVIPNGFHAYQNPPSAPDLMPLSVLAPKWTAMSKVKYPVGVPLPNPVDNTMPMVYMGTISIPVEVKAGAAPGPVKLKLYVEVQQCNDTTCFPPERVLAMATYVITAPPSKH